MKITKRTLNGFVINEKTRLVFSVIASILMIIAIGILVGISIGFLPMQALFTALPLALGAGCLIILIPPNKSGKE